MSHERALLQVNQFEAGLIAAIESVLVALQDRKIDVGEGMDIGSSGLMLAFQLTNVLRGLTPESGADLLWVYKNCPRVLPTGEAA